MGYIEVIEILLNNGASLLDMDRSPLHIACRMGKIEMIKLLLEKGAMVNQVDIQGKVGR